MIKKTVLTSAILVILAGCGGSEDESPKSSGVKPAATPISVSLNRTSIDIKEGDNSSQTEKVTIQANRNVDENLLISYKSENGTAKAGVDFVGLDGQITIPKGSRNVELTLTSIGNTIHQSSRDFTLVLTDLKMDGTTTVEKGASSATVRIADDDPEPLIQFSTAKITAHEDIGTVNLPIVFDRLSEKATNLRLTTAGVALFGTDYKIDALEVSIPPLTQTYNLPVQIVKDSLVEGTEPLSLTIAFTANAKLGEQKSASVFISGDLRLPDTGVTTFFNNGSFVSNVPDSAHPYQDAQYGLDVDPRFKGNGQAGFVYQKIDMAGNPLAADASNFNCVYDSHTGLTWEVKGKYAAIPQDSSVAQYDHALEKWNNASHRYLWRNLNAKNNGGSAGGFNDKELPDPKLPLSQNCAFPPKDTPLHIAVTTTGCVTDKYVELYNLAARCGFKDWRLPTISEITTIVSYQTNSSPFDTGYFSESFVTDDVKYLSSTPSVDNTASVWCFNASNKSVQLCNKQSYHHVRLVRGPKL